MKRKSYLLVLVFAALLVVSFFLYRWYESGKAISAWEFVPENAVLVYETNQVKNVWDEVMSQRVGKVAAALPFIVELRQNMQQLDSLMEEYTDSEQFFADNTLLTSMHLSGSGDAHFLFYIDLRDSDAQALFKKIITDIEQKEQLKFKQRNFQGKLITEISEKRGRVLSFIHHKNIVVASFAPVLIEDIARRLEIGLHLSFMDANRELDDVVRVPDDHGNIYISYAAFSALVKSMSGRVPSLLPVFADAALLDLKLVSDSVVLTGTTLEAGDADYMSIFKEQEPQSFRLSGMIPKHTAVLYQVGFSNPVQLAKSLENFRVFTADPFHKKVRRFQEKHNLRLEQMYEWMQSEAALCVLESANPAQPDKLVMIKTDKPDEAASLLYKLAGATASGNSSYNETLGAFSISIIEEPEFPALLLGHPFGGFEQTFFTLAGNTVVFANNLRAMRSFIQVQQREGGAGLLKPMLVGWSQQDDEKANLRLVVDIARSWNIFMQQASPKWKKVLKDHDQTFRKADYFTAQISGKGERFHTSIKLQLQKPKPTTTQTSNLLVKTNAKVGNFIVSRPFIVRNSVDRSPEMIFQDAGNMLYLLNKEGKVMFRHPVGSPLAGDVAQVELFGDGKLQYFFATKNKIYLLDRFGAVIDNYPVNMPDTISIRYASVIDYDNSKNYRFLVTNREGDMYLFDRNGESLKGWSPLRTDNKPASAPFHLRINGKDCIVSLQNNGTLHLFKRNGELYPDFPLQLDGRFASSFFVEQGSGFNDTYLTTISKEGLLYTINLEGKIIRREQAYRPSPEATFRICADATARSYIIARQNKEKVSVLDTKFKVLFERNMGTAAEMPVQYYNFGAGNEIIAVTDLKKGQTHLFDKEGRMQDFKAVKSSHEVGLIYSEAADLYFLYRSYGREAGIVTFRWN
jgi:hypothetical protein